MALRPGLAGPAPGGRSVTAPRWELWRRAEVIFDAALAVAEEERPDLVERTTAGDEEPRSAGEDLLRLDRGAPRFLDAVVADPPALGPLGPGKELEGRRLGPYRLVRRIGEGGMGAVFEALRGEDGAEQRVAIKWMPDGPSGAYRLQLMSRERQILARLQHANIAGFLDAGVSDEGWPYVVMEYVDGLPITEFCDVRRLRIRERVALFRKVCGAVGYAHRSLVVHRDLKPGNLLVTDEGEPKLLDFGISKLLDLSPPEDGPGSATTTSHRFLTPAYASPEQFRGEPVTTVSDIYSLGVLLFQVLTGLLPSEVAAGGESPGGGVAPASAAQAEAGPVAASLRAAMRGSSPSRLRRELRGELDSIVLRCLEPDPDQRYRSVGELDEDLRRYLLGLPVLARQQSLAYRLRRFVRRHAVAATLAGVALAALVGWVATGLAQSARLAEERDAATQARREAEEVTRFLTEAFLLSDPTRISTSGYRPGEEVTAREVLEYCARRVREELAEQPRLQARLLHTIAAVYHELGRYEEAEGLYRDAVATRRRLRQAAPLEVAESLSGLVVLYGSSGKVDDAKALAREALDLAQGAAPQGHPVLAECLTNSGMLDLLTGNLPSAATRLEESLAMRLRLPGSDPGEVALNRVYLGKVWEAQGRLREAESSYRRAYESYLELGGEDHAHLASVAVNLAQVTARLGRLDEAAPLFRRAYRIHREQLGAQHPRTLQTLGDLGDFLRKIGEYPESERILLEVIEAWSALHGPEDPNLAPVVNNLGLLYLDRGDAARGVRALRRALALAEASEGVEKRDRPLFLHNLGLALHALGAAPEAEERMRDAVAALRRSGSRDRSLLAVFLTSWADVLVTLERPEQAWSLVEEAEGILAAKSSTDDLRRAEMLRVRGITLLRLSRFGEAEEAMLRGLALFEGLQPPRRQKVAKVRKGLVELYEAWGRTRDADRYRDPALPEAPSPAASVSGR